MKKYSKMRGKIPKRKGWHIKNEPKQDYPKLGLEGTLLAIPLGLLLFYLIGGR